jgi:hypothetical protein
LGAKTDGYGITSNQNAPLRALTFDDHLTFV